MALGQPICNSASKLANVTWSGNTPTTRPFINVWSYGEYGRAFVTLTAH